MPLEPKMYPRVRIVDIDGTVVEKKRPDDFFTKPTVALPGAREKIEEWWNAGDLIIFWTARSEVYKQKTMDMLDELGFCYHELICGKPYSREIHIYDDGFMEFHQVVRDEGIGQME